MNFMPKNAKIFHCDYCNFKCSKESNWTQHLLTLKHISRTKFNDLEQKNAKTCQKQYECHCGKTYTARNSWWYHKKKCILTTTISTNNTNNNNMLHEADTGIVIDKHTIMTILLQNKEMMTKMMEFIPNMGSGNNNNNSFNTQNFNIQMFLNEHCKNAMNLTDFIDSLPITSDTYDSTIENGLTKTITNMLVNGLSQLDILDRPIHCTDATRKTLYVKDHNTWERDNELLHILKGIKTLSMKQRTMLNKWQDANRGWDTKDNLQSRMTRLIYNSMTSIENDDKETGKIIRAVSKNVYLDTDTKNQFNQLE